MKVKGILPDLVTYSEAIFTIINQNNNPPVFSTNPYNVSVPLKTSASYQFPPITDINAGDTTSITVFKDQLTGSLPGFITLAINNTSFTIYPTSMAEVKNYTMIVIISDNHQATTQYQFQINVTN